MNFQLLYLTDGSLGNNLLLFRRSLLNIAAAKQVVLKYLVSKANQWLIYKEREFI